MSTPYDDRMAYLAACEAEAAGKVAPSAQPQDTRTHEQEVMAAHGGVPSIEVQSKTHGAPLPAVDRGGAR